MAPQFLSASAAIEYLASPQNIGVEQWISSHERDGFRFISWVRIVQEWTRSPGKWCLYECCSLDSGDETSIDLDEFVDVGDPDEPEGKRHVCESVEQALSLAASLGAVADRYVIVGGLQYIYRDFFLEHGPPEKGAQDWFVSP